MSNTPLTDEEMQAIARVKEATPHVFAEHATLLQATAELEAVQQRFDRAKARWDRLGTNEAEPFDPATEAAMRR